MQRWNCSWANVTEMVSSFCFLSTNISKRCPGSEELRPFLIAEMNGRLQITKILMIFTCVVMGAVIHVHGDPEVNLLGQGCSPVKSRNTTLLTENLAAVLARMRSNISSSSGNLATAQQVSGTDSVCALFQCRPDKNSSDCHFCFNVAAKQIKNCSAVSGARAIYDGCFMRYEGTNFYSDFTGPGNTFLCANTAAASGNVPNSFSTSVQNLLSDIVTVAPRTQNLFAAQVGKIESELNDNSNSNYRSVYGLGYCLRTVTKSGCQQCLDLALKNIKNCLPRSQGRAFDDGCYLRYSTSSFFSLNYTTDLARFLSSGGSAKTTIWIILGVVVGVCGVLVMCLVLLYWFNMLPCFPRKIGQENNRLLTTELRGPVEFKLKVLEKATGGFSQTNKLGQGGFGEVYKGVLENGREVAVKRLTISGESARVMREFESEVRLISNVRHKNLVRLLGCCNVGPHHLLVYEFMPNSSLDRFLFGESRKDLSWDMRFSLILGTARGLAYLHDDFDVRIIHRDIKTSNILLDEDFCPKISDFGMARLLPQDQSHVTTRIAGTMGYTAPEYALNGQLTEKADVFSYGVVILEIISGRKSIDTKQPPHMQYLLEWAWKLYQAAELLDLVDEAIEKNYKEEEVVRVIKIALLCTQAAAAQRPSMVEVVAMLVGKAQYSNPMSLVQGQEMQPGLINVSHTSSSSQSGSHGTLSSTLTPR